MGSEIVKLCFLIRQNIPSCPGLTRASIYLRRNVFSKWMDCRVKPGNDGKKFVIPGRA